MGWPTWATPIVRAVIGNENGPIASNNPIYTEGGTVNQGTAGASPWKVEGVAGGVAQPVSISQTTDGTTNKVSTRGQAYDVKLTITRPANQTPYTAVDNVGGPLTFPAVGYGAGPFMITGVELELDIAALPAGMANFTLHLYNVTPPSAVVDNGPFTAAVADQASYLGKISLGTPVDLGATLYVSQENVNKQIRTASADVFGYLVTDAGFTPAANSEVYKVTLHTVAL